MLTSYYLFNKTNTRFNSQFFFGAQARKKCGTREFQRSQNVGGTNSRVGPGQDSLEFTALCPKGKLNLSEECLARRGFRQQTMEDCQEIQGFDYTYCYEF